MLTDGKGVPLAAVLSGANRHDMTPLTALLDAPLIADPLRATEDAPPGERHLCLDRGDDYTDRHPPPGTRARG